MAERLLTAIAGPMFSGKTEEVVRQTTRAEIAGKQVQVFKPLIDNRYGALATVKSHSGSEHSAIPVQTAVDILEHMESGTNLVVIDEIQFFGPEIVSVIETLLERGTDVVIAGLPLDFRGEVFGQMGTLLAKADRAVHLTAVCDYSEDGGICGREATRTQRLIDGSPADYNDPIVLIGGRNEGYVARCPTHHVVPGKPEREL
ncbi:hypothetical protein A2961_03385 [Candidatus Woesebacteria bacterium RIFCSPLOWO2_01_FULL_39_21]|uniref:Thymidine kinase n=1 Tax=Candidatus Woesebacteria bacterium RIFCSPLOWO2_01_FULL_39_21 TaxID=1802519 RepID=A0A1F8BG14_9BACT|nr:MAG: hypothetical protein A2961_03385 [Candidatus Woesebacteria bacterium RIFCSPLOWO2_01_FULL_39_21]